jgi:hypothetical protein
MFAGCALPLNGFSLDLFGNGSETSIKRLLHPHHYIRHPIRFLLVHITRLAYFQLSLNQSVDGPVAYGLLKLLDRMELLAIGGHWLCTGFGAFVTSRV